MTPVLSERRRALLLFSIVVLGWGITWVVIKVIVAHVPPLWTTAIRSLIATIGLLGLLLARREFIIPKRGDVAVVVVAGLFHMVAFSVLITIGLKYVPVGRSIVLGYTTPLWVAPGAWLFLREPMPRMRLVGIVIGLVGLLVMFNPSTFDWSDRPALIGNGVILLSALAWSVSILYVRAHRWISSPFQLIFWQALLASCVLLVLAFTFEGRPEIEWTPGLVAAFAYGGLVGTALAFWAMNEVNRRLPATTTALGILATPVVGIVSSALFLGEAIDPPLVVASVLILSGIAIGTIHRPETISWREDSTATKPSAPS
jgi:drug/metabolite transporter (DMT)-like permease